MTENRPLLKAVLFSVLSGLLFGFEVGIEGGIIVLSSFRQAFSLPLLREGEADDSATSSQLAWLVSLFPLSCAASALLFGSFSHDLSRKRCIFAGALIFTAGGLVQALCPANQWTVMQAGRVLGGISIGILSSITPVYIAELASADVRGALNTTFQIAITMGIALAFAINLLFSLTFWGDINWRLALGSQSVISFLMLLRLNSLPESPRLLMKRQQENEARQVLQQLRIEKPLMFNYSRLESALNREESKSDDSSASEQGATNRQVGVANAPMNGTEAKFRLSKPMNTNIDAEIEEMYQSLHAENIAGEVSWIQMFGHRLRLRTFIGCAIQAAQQLSFINAIMYYAPIIFSMVDVSPLAATALIGIVNVIATIGSLKFIDASGRVVLLLYSAIGMFIAALLIAFIVFTTNYQTDSVAGYLIVFFIFCHVLFFAIGFGPIGWIYPAEIHELSSKGKGVGLSTTVNWLGSTFVGLLVPLMLTKIGVGASFGVIALCIVFVILFVLFCVPESRGRSLESMPAIFKVENWQELTAWTAENWKNNIKVVKC